MKIVPKFHEFADQQTLCQKLSQRICMALQKAIAERGKASLVVSGGSTPVPLFTAMSEISMKWDRVFITLADERWVEVSDRDSNEASVRKHLMRNQAEGAHFHGLKNSHASAVDGEKECEEGLVLLPVPFDIVILGMGLDGHTASLFPGASRLNDAVDMSSGRLCMAMIPVTAPHGRMTLTLPALLDSRQIYLHLSGEEKRDVYERALGGDSVEKMPIRAVLNQDKVPVNVYWAAA
ncbi:MAG: 6-phosphogluconolactonase [Desulfobacteraceae bacterium]|nr:6-phosphogluconolactonase [Desulfobacteraceae bacterium]